MWIKIIKYHYQCQLLTLVASGLSSTIQRGSPSPHLAIPTITIDVRDELESSQMDPGSYQKACVCLKKIEVENIRLLFTARVNGANSSSVNITTWLLFEIISNYEASKNSSTFYQRLCTYKILPRVMVKITWNVISVGKFVSINWNALFLLSGSMCGTETPQVCNSSQTISTGSAVLEVRLFSIYFPNFRLFDNVLEKSSAIAGAQCKERAETSAIVAINRTIHSLSCSLSGQPWRN